MECPWRLQEPAEIQLELLADSRHGFYEDQQAWVWRPTPICNKCRSELEFDEVWPDDPPTPAPKDQP